VWAAGHGRCRGGVIQPVATCNARTRVWGLMPGRSLRTRETVEVETPALSAMSLMVVDASAPQPMQLLCNRLIYSTVYGGYPVKLLADVRTRVRTIVIFRLLAALERASGGCVQGAKRPAHTPQSLDTVAKTGCVRTHVRSPGWLLVFRSGSLAGWGGGEPGLDCILA